MSLKFSPGLLLAALMYLLIMLAAAALWVALWSYSIGLANIVIVWGIKAVIAWAALIILQCMKYDRERIATGLMAHHLEALTSDEGRPTDQPT